MAQYSDGPDISRLQKEVLLATPLGSDIDSVFAHCKSHYPDCKRDDEVGFYKQEIGESNRGVGNKHVKAFLGEFRKSEYIIGVTSIFWGFDKNGSLIEVWVWRTYDGP